MPIKFYDHPKTGVLHFRASAGGGDGSGSIFDVPATEDHKNQNRVEYNQYLLLKENGSVELKNAPGDLEARDLYIANLEGQLRTARTEIERLNRLLNVHAD